MAQADVIPFGHTRPLVTEQEVADLESHIATMEHEIASGKYAGRMPEVWETVKRVIKETRRLQKRVRFLEQNRGAMDGH